MSVHYSVTNATAHITLDAEEKRNALSPAMISQLTQHVTTANDDPTVRSIILGHTGNTFCSGADLSAANGGSMEDSAKNFLALLRTLISGPKPISAVVNRHVRAGGMGLLSACDVVFAVPDATFAAPEPRIGVAPALIALTVLPRMTNRSAAYYLLSGKVLDAETALASGLVTEIADHPAEAAPAYAAELLTCSPQGLAETRALLNRDMLEAFDARGAELAATSARLFASDEAQTGIGAFRNREKPPWVAVQ